MSSWSGPDARPDWVIPTARMELRPSHAGWLHDLWPTVSDPEVVRWTATWRIPADRDAMSARLDRPQPALGRRCVLVRDGRAIGMVGVESVGESEFGGLGYMLARTHWGQGLMREAVSAPLDWARDATGWTGVEAGIFVGNVASERILQRHGFAFVCDGLAANAFHGRDLPIHDYRLTWLSAPRACPSALCAPSTRRLWCGVSATGGWRPG